MTWRFAPTRTAGTALLALTMSVVGTPAAAQTCPAGNLLVAPDSRYTLSEPSPGVQLVTDHKTGLVWKRCSEGQSTLFDGCDFGSANFMTWSDALAAAAASGFAGYDDWRLPNAIELASLVESGCFSPAINPALFPSTPSSLFWTSTTLGPTPSAAWSVSFVVGSLGVNLKTDLRLVRLVRGGPSLDAFIAFDAGLLVESPSPGNNDATLAPATSASGRYVAFQSKASNLPDASDDASFDVFRVDTRCTGGLDPTGQACQRVQRVSLDDGGGAISGDAIEPSISADGQLVVFVAPDAAVAKVRNESAKQRAHRVKGTGFSVFLRNMLTGTTDLIGGGLGEGTLPQLAPSGTAVVFPGLNPPAGVGNPGQADVYIVPIERSGEDAMPSKDAAACVSCKTFNSDGSTSGTNADGDSVKPVVSADGSWVAWQTTAKNTLAGSPSPCPGASTEILLRNMLTGTTQRVGSPSGPSGCGAAGSGSGAASLDYSGTRIVFESNQPLKPGANSTDVYFLDLVSNSLQRLSEKPDGGNASGPSSQARLSGDGGTVAFVSHATDLDPNDADDNGSADIFVRSLRGTALQRLAKSSSGAEADRASLRPALDYVGGTLVFDSEAGNLTADSVLGRANVYQRLNPLRVDAVFGSGFE